MIIYTDGSCKFKKGAYGFITVVDHKINMCFVKREDNTTNNRMELMGLYIALRYVKKYKSKKEICIKVDSKYAVDGYNHWIEKWVRNGWTAFKGNAVLNQDLWEKLFDLKEQLSILNLKYTVEWVKAHANNKYNNYIDEIVKNITK